MKKLLMTTIILATGVAMADEVKQSDAPTRPLEPQTLNAVKFDISMPLRMMTPKPIVPQALRGGSMVDPGVIPTEQESNTTFQADPVLQSQLFGQSIPAPTASFDTVNNIVGASPPDPAGDVGPNHYVVMSNLFFAVYDKSGAELLAPMANNTLWSGFGGACENENSGDPIVLYDQMADRWLLTQFTSAGPEYFNCIALSQTGDPTGSYYRWALSNGNLFPDYPKYGIWHDAYYVSTRDFGSGYEGVGAYALDRTEMLAGNPNPTTIYFFVDRTTDPWRVGDGLLPADIDGDTMPPPGSPQYFVGSMDSGHSYGAPNDGLTFWEFVADFDTPANSSFTLVSTLNSASFDTIYPCGGGRNCLEQPDTTNLIDIQSYRQRPLHRLAYRNFGTHESLVTNQSVEASANIGGIRWWEIRDLQTTPTIHQEGTYGPGDQDGIHRWMGSIAMDQEGNMGLAYSATSSTLYPSIRYTGRLSNSPLGVMDMGEGSIVEGTGSQTSSQRWGDYTSLNIDPVDDCTFWHVNEYLTANGSNWILRVGSFKFDECGDPGFFLSASETDINICTSDTAVYDIDVGPISNFNDPVTLSVLGEPGSSTAAFSQNPVPSLPSTVQLTIDNTGAVVAGSYPMTVTGTATGADDKTLDLNLHVFDQIPGAVTLTTPTDGQVNTDTQPSLNWTGSNSESYTVEVSDDMAFSNIVFSGQTSGNTIVPSTALNTNSTYYWRVKAENACGETQYSAVFSFTTQAAPGECGIGTQTSVLLSEDFENGQGSFTTGSNVGPATWALVTDNANSGTSSMHADDVDEESDQTLTTPAIALPNNLSGLTLQFWNRQEMEDSASGCWDGGLLSYSTDGTNFTPITNDKMITDPYDGTLTAQYNNPQAGNDAWCGDPQDWLNSVVNIDDLAGQTVTFQFHLATDNSVSHPGWHIDDVVVQGCEVVSTCDPAPPTQDPDIIWFNGFQCVDQN